MDDQPARILSGVLSRMDRDLAEPALRPLERLLARPGASDSLIVALIGPSGVGKSTAMNLLAGARIVTAGPLRPTTTAVTVWGDVSTAYLPGARLSAAGLPGGIALVDTPPIEHYPDAVTDVLDRTDAAILVTSPDRYADALTKVAAASFAERGVPGRLLFVIEPDEVRDIDAITADAAAKLGLAVDAVVIDDAGPLRSLLDAMAADRDGIVSERDRGAGAFVADRARDVADRFAARAADAETLLKRAVGALEQVRVDRTLLAGTSGGDWNSAERAIESLSLSAVDDAIDELGVEYGEDRLAVRRLASASVSLPGVTREPIDQWHRSITEAAIGSMRHRRLHPLRRRAVREDMWRLAVDFDRTPSKRVRKALGGRLADLRIEGAGDLEKALTRSMEPRVHAFLTALDPYAEVTPDEIRAAADGIAASERGPVDGGGTDE